MTPAEQRESPGDLLATLLHKHGLADRFERVEELIGRHRDWHAADPDADLLDAEQSSARDLYGGYVACGAQSAFNTLQDLLDRFEKARDEADGTGVWPRLDLVIGVVADAVEIAEDASVTWADGEDEYADPEVLPGDDPEADAARYFDRRGQQ